MEEIKYMKLDYDDICEIIVEHYRDKIENSSGARCLFLGTPENDLRLIAAFSDDWEALHEIDLASIDKKIEFNGEHAFIKKAGYGKKR